jgi:hypothetical protein
MSLPEMEETMIGKVAFIGWACLLPVVAAAEEFPKQGTANYTIYSVLVASQKITPGKDNNFITRELNGVIHNDDGKDLFNNMGIRCLSSSSTTNGDISARGACIAVDKDGDQLFTNFESKGRVAGGYGGTDQFIGGTGKYAGITGKSDFAATPVKGPDNILMVALRNHATWTWP